MELRITALYAGLNALLAVALAIRVVQQRFRGRVLFGDGGVPELARAIRAHANNTEYVPIVLILLGVLEASAAPAWLLHALGAAFTLGRFAHAIGLSRSSGKSAARAGGMVLTWTVMAIAALLAVAAGLGGFS